MASYHVSLFTALRTVIGNTWTDVKANGIWHTTEFVQQDFEDWARNSRLPIALYEWELMPAEWGAGNHSEQGEVLIHRVQGDSESLETLVERLETMRTALFPDNGSNPLTNGQIMDYPRITYSMNDPLNRFFRNQMRPYMAGTVVCSVIMGDAQ